MDSRLRAQLPRNKESYKQSKGKCNDTRNDWQKEVDKLFKRPNSKTQRAQLHLAASLKQCGPPGGFYKYLERRNKKTPFKGTLSQQTYHQLPPASEKNVTLLASTLASVDQYTTSEQNTFRSYLLHTPNNTVNKVLYNNCQRERNDSYMHYKSTIDDEETIYKGRKSESHITSDIMGTKDKQLTTVLSYSTTISNKLLNVRTIDDVIIPRLVNIIPRKKTLMPEKFRRPCGLNSRTGMAYKCEASGIVPITSCMNRAVSIAINTKQPHDTDTTQTKLRHRPFSAPPSGYFKALNNGLHEHMNDLVHARGKLNCLFPKDRQTVVTMLEEGLFQENIDEKLEALFNSLYLSNRPMEVR